MMTTLLASRLVAIARPATVVTAALLVTGSVLATVGVGYGWLLYLAGYASLVVTLPALAAAHGSDVGRFGKTAFALATANAVLGTPVVAMVTTFVLGMDDLHLALMGYVLTPVGMIAAFGMNVSIVLVGLAIVRSRTFPAAVGWLLVAAAVAEFPVELGIFPLAVWAGAMVVIAIALGMAARQLGRDGMAETAPATA